MCFRTAQNTIFFRAATIASPASNEYFLDTKPVVAMRQPGLRFSRLGRRTSTLPKENWEMTPYRAHPRPDG